MTRQNLKEELICLICDVCFEHEKSCNFSSEDHAERFLELIDRFENGGK